MTAKRTVPTTVLILALATAGVAARKPPAQKPRGPEEVTIQELSHWFGPVTFSHGSHVALAGDCASCHHHSEGEAGPCGTCHAVLFDPSQPTLPTASVAFHERCVGCHRGAGAGPVACEGCHTRKALPPGPPFAGGK